jgi:hypothetical protein
MGEKQPTRSKRAREMGRRRKRRCGGVEVVRSVVRELLKAATGTPVLTSRIVQSEERACPAHP